MLSFFKILTDYKTVLNVKKTKLQQKFSNQIVSLLSHGDPICSCVDLLTGQVKAIFPILSCLLKSLMISLYHFGLDCLNLVKILASNSLEKPFLLFLF